MGIRGAKKETDKCCLKSVSLQRRCEEMCFVKSGDFQLEGRAARLEGQSLNVELQIREAFMNF